MSYTSMQACDVKELAEKKIKALRRSRRKRYRKAINDHRRGFFGKRTIKQAVSYIKAERYWELNYKMLHGEQESVCLKLLDLVKHSADGNIQVSSNDLYYIT